MNNPSTTLYELCRAYEKTYALQYTLIQVHGLGGVEKLKLFRLTQERLKLLQGQLVNVLKEIE